MIQFYNTQAFPYGCFSNFAPYGFLEEDVFWPTAEHYFQAQKYKHNAAYYTMIRKARTPKQAALLGRTRDLPIRSDWEHIKDAVMYRALERKFSTHPILRTILLSTGEQEIVENSPSDYYWGCGSAKTGENKLGKLLMRLRSELGADQRSTYSR